MPQSALFTFHRPACSNGTGHVGCAKRKEFGVAGSVWGLRHRGCEFGNAVQASQLAQAAVMALIATGLPQNNGLAKPDTLAKKLSADSTQ